MSKVLKSKAVGFGLTGD